MTRDPETDTMSISLRGVTVTIETPKLRPTATRHEHLRRFDYPETGVEVWVDRAVPLVPVVDRLRALAGELEEEERLDRYDPFAEKDDPRTPPTEIPEVEVELMTPQTHPRHLKGNCAWVVGVCPYCECEHVHSAGVDAQMVCAYLGEQAAQCHPSSTYRLVWRGRVAPGWVQP